MSALGERVALATWCGGTGSRWAERRVSLSTASGTIDVGTLVVHLDAESGRNMWSVRTGTGLLAGSDGSRITIGPDGSAWLGTLAGLVRVRDRS